MQINLDTLTLKSGGHSDFESGACLLEAASYMAGEPWSDHPKCVSAVLGRMGRSLNDRLGSDDRQKLKVFLPSLLHTADDGQDDARRWMAADWAVRVATPRLLDAAGLEKHAAALRALAPITDEKSARAARGVASAARDDAWIARNAARDNLRERLTEEFKKQGLAAAAAAAAAVDAAAAAAAAAAVDAVAVAAVDAAAVVAVAADADAVVAAAAAAAVAADAAGLTAKDFQIGSPACWRFRDTLYSTVRKAVRKHLLTSKGTKWAEVRDLNNAEAIALFGRMINPNEKG